LMLRGATAKKRSAANTHQARFDYLPSAGRKPAADQS